MKNFLTATLFLLISYVSFGQKQWELGLFAGTSNYQGDVVKPSLFTLKETNPAFGLMLSRHFNQHWALRGNFMYGKISGTDANFTDRVSRGYSFSSPVTELSLVAVYDVFGNRRMREGVFHKGLSPYFFLGGGVGMIKPETNYNENGNDFNIANINKDKADGFNKTNFVLPVGAGFKYYISSRTTLGLEMGFRPSFTDKLDNISLSGNPKKDDWYVFGGLTLGFRLGKMEEKAMTEMPKVNVPVPAPPAKPEVKVEPAKPQDTDGDGIPDSVDRCPNVAGVTTNYGCPAPVDTDGDGIVDADDRCPTVKGILANSGCPVVDTDGDGIEDSADRCPTVAGVPSNYGCPTVTTTPAAPTSPMTKEEAETVNIAIKNINFETSKAILTTSSYTSLDKILVILKKYPEYNITIDGHTDSDGDAASNQRLSESRAKACMSYFVSKGIDAKRMTAKGFGETKPVASNSTPEGKRQNRRVEFNLVPK